jgi:deoxyribonuclease V
VNESVKSEIPHPWDVTPQEAIAIQERLRHKVVRADQIGAVRSVAGVDVGFEANGAVTRAAVVILSYPALEIQERVIARRPTAFPYVPGLLSFREVPAILDALEQLSIRPDLLLCDGQGLAHPRRFGLACHLGVLVDLPSIGVGKSRLVGSHEPLGAARGERQPLQDSDETIGMVLRTRTGVKPLFVSIGHRVSLETAVSFVLRCGGKYRLPEPIRQAHHLASSK